MAERNPFIDKGLATQDTKSGAKAKAAHDKTVKDLEAVNSDSWPRGSTGEPMMKIVMTAAELVPTGQYANVSIGPVQITAFVDEKRKLEDGESYFTHGERATMAQALNELAEVVEGDVVAVQRNIVLENLQEEGE
jgi:hypothetical protein